MTDSVNGATHYKEYLQLDKLLDAQKPLSKLRGQEAHDETLFILVHQVYELWFKQIIHELDSVVSFFSQSSLDDRHMVLVTQRLERILKIQNVIIEHLPILETMTPMDFLEFRDLLVPASGFQSLQFKKIEMLLGLKQEQRLPFDRQSQKDRLSAEERATLEKLDKAPSLFELIEKWLERTPFLETEQFSFWSEYQGKVHDLFSAEKERVQNNTYESDQKELLLRENENTQRIFDSLFDDQIHQDLVKNQKRRISRKALLAALFINLYRSEPALQQPHRLLQAIMNMDENLTTWRLRHSLMAHRMLGTKLGTGGSSGHQYLRKTAEKYRIFEDFFNLSAFYLSSAHLPELPEKLKKQLAFNHNL